MSNRIKMNLSAYVLLTIGALLMLIPFLWMISTSLKSGGAALELPPRFIPHPIAWENYKTVWVKVDFMRYTINSTILVVLDVVGTLISCSFVGYGLAMFTFKGRNLIFILMLVTMMLPFQVTMIPSYFIWKVLGGLNTYYPLILPSFLGGAFGIFLMRQFYKGIPVEMFEAAMVDGYNPWGAFWRIYLPLSKPALATLGVFSFINNWNNTIGPLIYLQSKEMYTLPLALLFLKGEVDQNTTLVMAGAVITTIPVILVFLLAQKHFIQGIATSGLKG